MEYEDIMMPGMSGLEVLFRMRKNQISTPNRCGV